MFFYDIFSVKIFITFARVIEPRAFLVRNPLVIYTGRPHAVERTVLVVPDDFPKGLSSSRSDDLSSRTTIAPRMITITSRMTTRDNNIGIRKGAIVSKS